MKQKGRLENRSARCAMGGLLECRIFTILKFPVKLEWPEMTGSQPSSDMPVKTTIEALRKPAVTERWFFTVFACSMIAVAGAGFLPSILHTAGRRAPLSPLAAAHGIVFFAWLGIFLAQASLVATRHVALHRRLGIAAAFVAALMVPLAYETSIAMVRRGFDLSGDLRIEHDPAYEVIFPPGGCVPVCCAVRCRDSVTAPSGGS